MRQKIFRWNRKLHRDLGYLTVGLTIIFAVSGIALNHLDQWNPSYDIEVSKRYFKVAPAEWNRETIPFFLKEISVEQKYQSHYFSNPDQVKIFLKNGSVTLYLKDNEALVEKVRARPILREWVELHRNKASLAWTIVSDLYAVLLLFLAIGGLFMVKGKNGLKWRATLFALFGIWISVIFMYF